MAEAENEKLMPSATEIMQAEHFAREQRRSNIVLLITDSGLLLPGEHKLVAAVMKAAEDGDIDRIDAALANPAVVELFRRGVLKWRKP